MVRRFSLVRDAIGKPVSNGMNHLMIIIMKNHKKKRLMFQND